MKFKKKPRISNSEMYERMQIEACMHRLVDVKSKEEASVPIRKFHFHFAEAIDAFVCELLSKKNGQYRKFSLKLSSDDPRYYALMPSSSGIPNAMQSKLPIDLLPDLYRYSWRVELFFSVFLNQSYFSDQCEVSGNYSPEKFIEEFNKFVAEIRSESELLKFKRQGNARESGAKKNFIAAGKYVNSLFDRHDQLHIRRFDFNILMSKNERVFPKNPQYFLKKYMGNWRTNRLFENIVGYIWKLEFIHEELCYFHMIFFISDFKQFKGVEWSRRIGQYWESITEGIGSYFDCGRSLDEGKRSCIGLISKNNLKQRQELLDLISYLTKKKSVFEYKDIGNARTFGHGVMKR